MNLSFHTLSIANISVLLFFILNNFSSNLDIVGNNEIDLYDGTYFVSLSCFFNIIICTALKQFGTYFHLKQALNNCVHIAMVVRISSLNRPRDSLSIRGVSFGFRLLSISWATTDSSSYLVMRSWISVRLDVIRSEYCFKILTKHFCFFLISSHPLTLFVLDVYKRSLNQ